MSRAHTGAGEIPRELEPLRATDVAAVLQCNVKTVYEAAERGEIPGYFRVGRLVFFRRAPVLRWLGQGAPSEGNT